MKTRVTVRFRRTPIRSGRTFPAGRACRPIAKRLRSWTGSGHAPAARTSSSGSVTTCSTHRRGARSGPRVRLRTSATPSATGPHAKTSRVFSRATNGKNPMSVRELAKEMGVALDTANKQQRRLEAFGFIAATVKGWRGPTHQASTWRLTEYGTNDRPLATRDYLDIEEADFARIENSILRPKKQDGPSYDLGRLRPKNAGTTNAPETKAQEIRGSALRAVLRFRTARTGAVL